MENTNLAQWVIDNRYAKSEKEKVSDVEMYHNILEHTAQLQADKAELLEALEILRGELTARTPEKVHDMADSLVQKMKP